MPAHSASKTRVNALMSRVEDARERAYVAGIHVLSAKEL
jgi:hypothetical protein